MYLNATQIAEIMGVQRRTFVNTISKRPDFPRPFVISRVHLLWAEAEVHEYIRKQRRRRCPDV